MTAWKEKHVKAACNTNSYPAFMHSVMEIKSYLPETLIVTMLLSAFFIICNNYYLPSDTLEVLSSDVIPEPLFVAPKNKLKHNLYFHFHPLETCDTVIDSFTTPFFSSPSNNSSQIIPRARHAWWPPCCTEFSEQRPQRKLKQNDTET